MSDHHPAAEERLAAGYTGRVLAATSLGNATVLCGLLVLPPLLPRVVETLSLSSTQAGVALTVMWAGAATFQYPGGRAADDLTRKTVLAASLAVIAVGCLVLSSADGYGLLLVGTASLGVGAGLYWPTMFALTADLFERRRGGAFGVVAASGDVGGVLATGLAGLVLAATASWQRAFLPVGLAGLGVVAVAHRWNAEPYAVRPVRLGVRQTLRRLFATPGLRGALVAFGLFMFVYQGATGFVPTLLRAEMGFSPRLATDAFAVLFVAGILLKPLAGRVGDRVGHAAVAAVAALGGAGGLAVLLAVPGRLWTVAGLCVFAAGMAALWPTLIADAVERFPDGSVGGDLGGFRTLTYGVGSAGSTYVGAVAGRASYAVAFAGLAAGLVGVGALATWLAVRGRPS